MRVTTSRQVTMLGVIDPEQLISADHPIRRIRPLVESALVDLEPTFERMGAEIGPPSIPPEHLLKSCLLMALYLIRSERQFCERLRYDLLFKMLLWFVKLFDEISYSHGNVSRPEKRTCRWGDTEARPAASTAWAPMAARLREIARFSSLAIIEAWKLAWFRWYPVPWTCSGTVPRLASFLNSVCQ